MGLTIPASWTDLDMIWDDVHAAPFDPYYLAIGQAITERAAVSGLYIDPILTDPTPTYPTGYRLISELFGFHIQDAVTDLIPLFNEIGAKQPWTESSIINAIGDPQRYGLEVSARWLKQQYDILNKLLEYNWTNAVFPRKSIGNRSWKAGVAFDDKNLAISNYNSAGWISGVTIRSNPLYGVGGPSDFWRIEGHRWEYSVRALSGEIPVGSLVDVYVTWTKPSAGYYFIPLDGKVEGVQTLEAENVNWQPDGGGSVNIGTIINVPDTVTAAYFPINFNAISEGDNPRLFYQKKPDPDFNFKL